MFKIWTKKFLIWARFEDFSFLYKILALFIELFHWNKKFISYDDDTFSPRMTL